MKGSSSLYLGLGLILVAITSIIFFVPRDFEYISSLEFAKFGIIIASQLVLIGNMMMMANKKSIFPVVTIMPLTSIWFIVNLVLVLLINTMQNLIVWTSVLFLVYIAITLILSFFSNHIGDDLKKEKKIQEENKKKNVYKK